MYTASLMSQISLCWDVWKPGVQFGSEDPNLDESDRSVQQVPSEQRHFGVRFKRPLKELHVKAHCTCGCNFVLRQKQQFYWDKLGILTKGIESGCSRKRLNLPATACHKTATLGQLDFYNVSFVGVFSHALNLNVWNLVWIHNVLTHG